MKTNQDGLNLLKSFEGLRLSPYKCSAGVWTNGYGNTFNVTATTPAITKEQAENQLANNLKYFELGVLKLTKSKINENQFSSVVCFTYNLGVKAYERSSLRMKINRGDYSDAALSFMLYNKARVNGVLTEIKGLTRRRVAEKQLFLKPKKTQQNINNSGEPQNNSTNGANSLPATSKKNNFFIKLFSNFF